MVFFFVWFCFVWQRRRGMLESIDAEAAPAAAAAEPRDGRPAQHNVPDVLVSAGLRHLLLPQRRHVFHHQDRRVDPLQLRVSRHFLALLT